MSRDLSLGWQRLQIDSNGITKTRVTTFVNRMGDVEVKAQIDLTEAEARYLLGADFSVSASAAVIAIGFSQRTCLPASRALTDQGTWR